MSNQEHTETTKHRRKGKTVWILSILLSLALAGCGTLYWQYARASAKDPQAQQQQWIAELNKVIVAPGETPVITTVLDKSKLTNKTLAAHAINGDRLYIYGNAKRLILYRPSSHKVVDMLTIQSK